MYQYKHILAIAFALLFTCTAVGQSKDSLLTHYVGLEAHIGYDNMFTRTKDLHDIGGVGGGLGFIYKFQYRSWRFHTGLSITSLNSLSRGGWYSSVPVIEPYPTMTLNDRFDDVRYRRHALSTALPIMAGYRWQNFTFMAGLAPSFPVWQTTYFSGNRRSTITDEQLYGEFIDMPNHGLTTTPFEETRAHTMNLDFSVIAEVVWDLDKYLAYHPKKKTNARRHKKTFKELLHYEASLFAAAGVLNSGTTDEPLNSFFVGARFAVFYEFEHPQAKKKTTKTASKPASKPKPASQTKPKPKPQQPAPATVTPDTMYYGEQVITKGEAIVLQNLYFAVDKTDVLPSSQAALDELYTFLAENPDVRIRIVGHTDNTASEQYNLKLSKGRAQAVAQQMIIRGIAPSRLETEGKGMSEPVADNSTSEGRQQNRRVEFIVL